MIRPRTAKLLRDLWIARGRAAVMVVAIAVALSGVGALLVARAVVMREAAAAYAGTNPAAATLDVEGGVDGRLLAQVRARPGIADATARQSVLTRVRVDGQWRRMLLFVIAPDDPLRIAGFRTETGTWPPPDGGLLIERAASAVLAAGVGTELAIAGPAGELTTLSVAGTVYDPALAPAVQERTGYGYLTPAGLARLGFAPAADELKITVGAAAAEPVRDQATVDATTTELAAWLAAHGHTVHQVQAPPYRHPHQNQTDTITAMFLGFAVAALVLAGVLVAATFGGMLATQTRQIGVMKTVGATTGQLLRLYLAATVAIAALATLLAVGPGLLAGNALVDLVAGLLNIDITSRGLPWWVPLSVAGAGLVIPVLVALVPLLRAARITVRAALDDHGADPRAGTRRGDRWVARLRGSRVTVLAVGNLLRRRSRLVLTVALLAAGGALFTAGLNTAAAWQSWVDDGLSRRSYDTEIQLAAPVPAEPATEAACGVSGVRAVEALVSVPATPATSDGQVHVQRTYPDGGHGRFSLIGLPADTDTVHFDVTDGRWLQPRDAGAVVLNQGAAARLGNPQAGDTIQLAVDGTPGGWQVVGVVAEVGGPAAAYTVPEALTPFVGAEQINTLRIRIDGDPQAVTDRVEAALSAAGLPVASVIPTTELASALDEHVAIFIYTLIVLAVLTAVVGVLGLASTMSISIIERTREYGIMQAIGATPGAVRRIVLTEGTLAGAIGCAAALVLGIPLSAVVGDLIGRLSFGLPLPLQPAPTGLATWLVLAVAGAAAATLAAAQRAAGLTIRETLTHQ